MIFKEGDIVILKSGGPTMTIKFKTSSDLWLCSWFVSGILHEGSFSEQQLSMDMK